MFFETQPQEFKDSYENLLQNVGGLTRLFSDSTEPYLYYRVAERAFCKAFSAIDHSRSDIAVDSSKDELGIGLKTFLQPRNYSYQKIAEFNQSSTEIHELLSHSDKLIDFLSEQYNARVQFALNSIDLSSTIYHCILRRPSQFIICEYPMSLVEPGNLHVTRINNPNNVIKTIDFTDGNTDFKFNSSKSTLFRKFELLPNAHIVPIEIWDEPFNILDSIDIQALIEEETYIGRVVLPLYSYIQGHNVVPERSGLNQWNASGRPRHENEVYIRIPKWIHNVFDGFFPPRHQQFNLILPSGKQLTTKVCQDNNKALMSNPNSDLGEWLLRDVLEIVPGTIITYETLINTGLDSVEITKISDEEFNINFKEIGTYEKFIDEYNQ